jgi:undecaprenyl-diphosphatase
MDDAITALIALDQSLFHTMNGQWRLAILDAIAPLWREKTFWIPLYVVLATLALWSFRRRGFYLLLAAGLCVGIADMSSSRLIKQNVQRLRPCNDPLVRQQTVLLVRCGAGYSFTSSHAANHFALAIFLALTLGLKYRALTWALPLWAATIAYAQVYVGVHYPLDVLCGALLGILVGWVVARLFQSRAAWRLPE